MLLAKEIIILWNLNSPGAEGEETAKIMEKFSPTIFKSFLV